MNSNEFIVEESILKIGCVSEIKGRLILVKVDKEKNSPHLIYNGEVLKNVSVGSYIKICKGFNEIIGKIEGEFISEDKTIENHNYLNYRNRIRRFLNVTLIGYFENGSFNQGLKEIPLIENDCFLLNKNEFDSIHNFAKPTDKKLKIGSLLNEDNTEIMLGADKLFASHIGVFGNTGSGKSYTLTKLYHELFNCFKKNKKFNTKARFLLIDFNGEYARDISNDNIIIENEYKQRFFLSTAKSDGDKLSIPENVIKDSTFWSILLKATEQTQKPFLEASLSSLKISNNVSTVEGLKSLIKSNLRLLLSENNKNTDKNFHLYFIDELLKFEGEKIFINLISLKEDYKKNLTLWDNNGSKYISRHGSISAYNNQENFLIVLVDNNVDTLDINIDSLSPLKKIRLSIIFNYFYSILKGFYNKEHIAPLIGRLENRFRQISNVFEVADIEPFLNDKLLTIISLNDVNVEMKKIIPLVISKYYYEFFKNTNDTREKYLNIIVDEAHNILSKNSIRESETWKDYRLETFEEIIKEGRKFGVFLTLASQRPSDISDTIISQLHNYFLHRLINNKDIEAISRTVAYLDKVSFESLSILPQGACVLAGLSADLPVIIKINKIEDMYKPYNDTICLTENWID